ncbi:MAG TPA: L,D-transpeptidase, partial [Polyangiaceae bacterium]
LQNQADASSPHPADTQAAAFQLPKMPLVVHEARDRLLARSTVAYSTEVAKNERNWLLTADMRWLPQDRVRAYPKILFKGVELGKEAELPIALFRTRDRPKYVRRERGEFVEAPKPWPRLSWVALSGESVEAQGRVFLKSKSGDEYLAKQDAVMPVPRAFTPWGARVGEQDKTGKAPPGRATWIEASVRGGWLIAFEGTKPVYATLISAGLGGTPTSGKSALETASTPTGRFLISGKFATATMAAPNEFIHTEVPWTQNFSGPHALHAAYWHNDWGDLKSGGCVNVSPIDGRWLFQFTEPELPQGWHGVRWLPKLGPATTFIVHE